MFTSWQTQPWLMWSKGSVTQDSRGLFFWALDHPVLARETWGFKMIGYVAQFIECLSSFGPQPLTYWV